MDKFGKGIFGKGFNIKAEVTHGLCPLCESKTIFVSIYEHVYRCMKCGGDTEQKVNGVISYMPLSSPDGKHTSLNLVKDTHNGQ
tara:strand:+ start:518 stop:769 length:252 start_codon:yes stop_codon:yes gene_type:complete